MATRCWMRRTARSKARGRLAYGRKPIPSSRSTTCRSLDGDSMNATRVTLTLLGFIIVAGACGRRDGDSASSRSGETTPSVVVYCSADKEFAELIFHAYV